MTLPELRLSIGIIDSNPVLSGGICALLMRDTSISARSITIGSSTGEAEVRFDVIIVDPTQTEAAPAVLFRDLGEMGSTILAYSGSESEDLARACILAGFRGVLPKTVSFDVLKIALATTARGGIFIDAAFAAAIAPRHYPEEKPIKARDSRLSGRELFVLKSVAHGMSMKEIGKELDLSSKTIETYKARGTSKLRLTGRRQIVEFAISQGWVETTRVASV